MESEHGTRFRNALHEFERKSPLSHPDDWPLKFGSLAMAGLSLRGSVIGISRITYPVLKFRGLIEIFPNGIEDFFRDDHTKFSLIQEEAGLATPKNPQIIRSSLSQFDFVADA